MMSSARNHVQTRPQSGCGFRAATAPAHAATIPIERSSVVDTLTAIILAVIVLILAAPIIEIAVKRPRLFRDIADDTRAFAEAPVPEAPATPAPAERRDAAAAPRPDDRLADLTS
jgi:hypothetical protein